MSSMFKRKTQFVSVITVALCLLTSCGGKKDDKKDMVKPYPVLTLSNQDTELNTDYPATLQGEQTVEIRPKVDGYIDAILIDEGATVHKGQVLFRISNPQYGENVRNANALIASAKADVAAADLQVQKTRPLVEKDIISKYELESAQLTLKMKKAALAQAMTTLANAKTNLGYTTVTSPVNGVVGLIPYKVGSLITATTPNPLTTVSKTGKIYAYFSFNEKQILDLMNKLPGKSLQENLKKMPPVSLLLSDGTEYAKKGRIEIASGLVDSRTGSVSLRATFENPTGLIRSGGSGTVRISEKVSNALLVPQKSTYELQGKHFVYVVDAKQMVLSKAIETKEIAGRRVYVVTSGLKAGDRIVLKSAATLKDSAVIKPLVVTNAEAYSEIQ